MTTSPSLPASKEPTRSAMPMARAGLMVMACQASSISSPASAAIPAHIARDSKGITGESVMMLMFTPALCKIAGVVKDLLDSSILDLEPKVGPTKAG